ncbi:Alpha/beta hydrolase fold-1 [Aspergillus crustosus]
MTLPTILLIHGAWHTPAHYSGYIAALQKKGLTVHAPHLPTCDPSFQGDGQASIHDDIAHVRTLATELVQRGEKVIVVMHSYGGAVGTDAVEGLGFPYHSPPSSSPSSAVPADTGGVIHLLYLCAYILPPATAVWDIVQQAGFDKVWDQYIHTSEEDGTIFPHDPAMMFFSGTPSTSIPESTVDFALSNLVRFPLSALKTPVSGSKKIWESVPVTYLSTKKRDYAVPGAYQGIMLEGVENAGVGIEVLDVDSSHSVFVEREKEMVDVVLGIVEKDQEQRGV